MYAISRSVTVHIVVVVEETVADAVGRRYQRATRGTDSGIGSFIFADALVVMVISRNHEHVVSAAGRTVRRGWRIQATITSREVQIC